MIWGFIPHYIVQGLAFQPFYLFCKLPNAPLMGSFAWVLLDFGLLLAIQNPMDISGDLVKIQILWPILTNQNIYWVPGI